MTHSSLRPLVALFMGPLAFGGSSRTGQRERQISSASPAAFVIPVAVPGLSPFTAEAALVPLSVFYAFSPAGGERKAPNTFNRRKTLS